MPSAKWQIRVCSPSQKKFLVVVEKEATISGLIREISSVFGQNYPSETPLEEPFYLSYENEELDPHATVEDTLKQGDLVNIKKGVKGKGKMVPNGKDSTKIKDAKNGKVNSASNVNGIEKEKNGKQQNGHKPEKKEGESAKKKPKTNSASIQKEKRKKAEEGEGEEEKEEMEDEREEIGEESKEDGKREEEESEDTKEEGKEDAEKEAESERQKASDSVAEKSDEPGPVEEMPTKKRQLNGKNKDPKVAKKRSKVSFAEPPESEVRTWKNTEEIEDHSIPKDKAEENSMTNDKTENATPDNSETAAKPAATKAPTLKSETPDNKPAPEKEVTDDTEKTKTPSESRAEKIKLPETPNTEPVTKISPHKETETIKTPPESQIKKDGEIMPPPTMPTKKEISPPKGPKKEISPSKTTNTTNGVEGENGKKPESATPVRKRIADTNPQTPTPAKKVKVSIPKSLLTPNKSPFSLNSPQTSFSSAVANLSKNPFSLSPIGFNKGFPISPLPPTPLSSAPLFPKSNTTNQL